MNGFLQDLRYAFRTTAKSPGFTAVAVLTLALGIGANTTMFSVVNAILLRPLPYPEAGSLIGFTTNQSGPDLEDLSRQSRSLARVAGAQIWPLDWSNGAEPERVQAAVVTGQTFAALGGRAELGRALTPADDRPGAEPVMVVGHGFWQARLGSALLLAGSGLAVTSYGIEQRTREIGVCMALGADRRRVLLLVVGEALKTSLVGLVLGLAASALASRLLASLLFDVRPFDPSVLASVAVFLLASAVVASSAPALRSARLDPVEALRAP